MAKRKKRSYKFKHSFLARRWRRYQYKHTTTAILIIMLFVLALDTALVRGAIEYIETLGIFGIMLAGMMFVSFFTAAPAIVLLLAFNQMFDPLTIAFYAAIGSVIGDLIILKLFEEKVGFELKPLAKKWKLTPLIKKMQGKKYRGATVLFGMFSIASPLPDEMGLGLMGIAHLPTMSLLTITFLLNAAGILVLVLAF